MSTMDSEGNYLRRSSSSCSFLTQTLLILSLAGVFSCESILGPKDELKTILSTRAPLSAAFIKTTKPLETTLTPSAATSTTKQLVKTTKAYVEEEPTTQLYTKPYANTKSVVKSATRQKLNTSALESAGSSAGRLQERLGAIDCDLPVLPRESRLWRGNETHELNLPLTDCAGGNAGSVEDCPPVIVSWEGSADIQSGDILIVRLAADSLLDNIVQVETKNSTEHNVSRGDGERVHRTLPQPAVYQVTRQGHEHCDTSDGMLLDITPLDEHGAKLITLYDKDLTEGVNLLIVVSENWGSQCVRLKVTVKSDNCGESQDCSGKGVCYTNVSMEGYECQCCPGYMGPHCEERDVCNPSPCLNNGICVPLTQPLNGADYHCLCPYGFTGRNCEKDPCYSSPCLNGGSCMSMALNGSTTFHCACTDAWSGTHCERSTVGGACASSPCVNGICIEHTDNEIEDYRCFCQPGYTGDRCEAEYNECESSPCSNGGTCTDRINGFECVCGRGYTGNTCQLKVDLCSPNPCPLQRFCVDHGNSYECKCPHGYFGEECHLPAISTCDNNPCAHGGTCWSGVDSFYCSCRPGYTGKLCEEDFILESVVGDADSLDVRKEDAGSVFGGGGSVREVHMPLGLYHDRLHNVYIAAGTLGAAIAIVGIVVTACHCRVNKTYSRLLSRLSRATSKGPPHHWLQDKHAPTLPPTAPFPPPSNTFDTADMYYTLDFSDSQSSPLIQ